MKLTPEFKTLLKTSLLSAVFTVLLLMLISYFFNHTWNLFYKSNAQPFTAQGTGTAKAEPDQAEISFTVTKTAPKLEDAQNQANTATNTMVAAVKQLGVEKKDIKTSNYSSYPNYAQTPVAPQPNTFMMPVKQDNQTIESYTVTENITISIADQEKVNTVIDAVTKAGAENVSGPNYTFSDAKQKELMKEARDKAIADAKDKAQSLAQASGIHLGKLTSVQEGNTGYPVIRPMMLDAKTAGGTAVSAPTEINPGQNEVTDTVTLSYETY
jgi:uncharacterized protein YggE